MKSSGLIWIGFGLCLALVVGAMGWLTATTMRLGKAEAAARTEAALEENVRLALWRMDSALAPVLAQESAQPILSYRTFVSVQGSVIPSPLLAAPSPLVTVHFQVSTNGEWTSPEIPGEGELALAVPDFLSQQRVGEVGKYMEQLRHDMAPGELFARLPEPAVLHDTVATGSMLAQDAASSGGGMGGGAEGGQSAPMSRGGMEFRQRGAIVSNTETLARNQVATQNRTMAPFVAPRIRPSDLAGAAMTAFWVDGQLLLARRVLVDGSDCIQGALVDWSETESRLLGLVADLLPEARLQAAAGSSSPRQSRRLAAIPVRLEPGRPSLETTPAPAPIRVSLAAAWLGAALAMVAVAILLRGVLQLSERRAAFVSAVTHELRTPLTTFRMYTEMLTEGMVTGEDKRQEYLETLEREASRLTHLVENVLAYARLERNCAHRQMESLPLTEMLDGMLGRLSTYAGQAGLELLVEIDDGLAATWVLAHPSSVEQILVNLIDNAGKYAAKAADRRIHLTARRAGRRIGLVLRDHGPGIRSEQARRIFRPFSKSASEAAHSAPGVGLGLALSRRLARSMQGELSLDSAVTDGACFVLALRVVRQADEKIHQLDALG